MNFSQNENFLGKKKWNDAANQLIKLFVNIVQTKVIETFFLTCKKGETFATLQRVTSRPVPETRWRMSGPNRHDLRSEEGLNILL